MRLSQFYCPTLRETPSDAEVISHQLMLRAGMIRKVASGIYTILPMGLRVFRKMEAIIRQEMTAVGGNEVLMPMVIPEALWVESGRWDQYGKELLRVSDRHGNAFCLGPTHEEVITDLVRNELKSYRQLPKLFYQIQTKFRDEIRPRFGIMRGREFSMKDAYSFHDGEASLQATYAAMATAYDRIFSVCGLQFIRVAADSGAIGGDVSAEYVVVADSGEDMVLQCGACGYAANVEVCSAQASDPCPECTSDRLQARRGIEVGHIFKLGTKYSAAMNAVFLDAQGKIQPFAMGCYGIGVGRTIAAAIEQSHDAAGIIWPVPLAPFCVVVLSLSTKEPAVTTLSETLYRSLSRVGIDVAWDDREESAGIKFKDAELIGYPYQVVVGKKSVETGLIEIKNRRTGETVTVSAEAVVDHLRPFCA
jgi:prolyl-tRNA synthetase